MEKITVLSDIGSVLVGNESFQVALWNGYGDGYTTVIICSREEFAVREKFFEDIFNTSVKGTINIYGYDCSDGKAEDIVKTINGRYFVYYNNGTVIFVKWE